MQSRLFKLFLFVLFPAIGHAQQDVIFHLNTLLLPGKTILKVKRDFHDPYLWVLATNNEVYRINSLTNVIDDYTAQFAAFSSTPFIDIAGRSKDTVFIATHSTNLIYSTNGINRIVGSNEGINGPINSIGLYYNNGESYNYYNFLYIGTDNGYCNYRLDKDQITGETGNKTQVFEATYRRLYKTVPYIIPNADTIMQPSLGYAGIYVYEGDLWKGYRYGNDYRTAYMTTQTVYGDGDQAVVDDIYWGNEKGMFQICQDQSFHLTDNYKHYLNNLRVNKITSLYGLTGFGGGHELEPIIPIRENILVGTDSGLYVSTSMYSSSLYGIAQFTLSHDNTLGSMMINDINVNAASTVYPICEDGVWIATNNGLYLLKPDYNTYTNSSQFRAVSMKGQSTSADTLNVCSGNSITALVNSTAFSKSTVQWYKNGIEIPAASADTLIINSPGNYNALLYDPCSGTHIQSNHLTVNFITSPAFSFNYPDKLQYCDSTSTILKTDFSSNYHYRWYTNGVLNGDTTAKYTVTQSGKYKVEVSACTNSWVPSKEIEVDLINLPLPQITADKNIYCQGDSATLTLNVPADPAYTINWYQDGNLISGQNKALLKAGSNGNYTAALVSTMASCSKSSVVQQVTFISSPAFTFNYPDVLNYCDGTPVTLQPQGNTAYHYRWYLNGALTGDSTMVLNISQSGSYNVEVSACAGSWVPSKTIQVNFIKLPVPVIQADKVLYCIGDRATLSVTTPLSNAYTINWYRDNTLLTAQQNQTSLITTTAGNYSVRISSTLISCDQQSTVQPVIFNPEPTISIAQSVITTLCSGQPVNLSVSYTGGTIQWSTGETTAQITVKQSGTYKATITSAAGCVADTSITLQMLPLPVLTLKDTTVCTYTRQSVTLSAPPGFSSYSWNNGASVASTYLVSTPETVSLTVTDANGCQATQQVTVSGQCPDVHLPNTFTPNGDGINDNWDIAGLENDATVLVSVYNRYGTMVYQSRGYNIPWNGTYQAKKLPTATYYYIITAKNGKQTFSGSVTIVY